MKETPILCARCGTDNRPDKRFCRLCGAGRVEPALRIAELAAEVASMRDSLSGGALAIIGTLWPIYDEGAAEFASTFYEKSLAGRNLGEGVRRARLHVRETPPHDVTWASIVLCGKPSLNLLE